MKKKILIVCLAIVCLMASLTFVACDKKQSDNIIKAEYVENLYDDYIRIWYDESWFPEDVHIDSYSDNKFLRSYSYAYNGGHLYCEQLTNYNGSWSVVPNTWMYIDYIYELRDYNYITLKVCKGYSHYINNDDDCELFAEYTISIK